MRFGKVFDGSNDLIRCKIITYAADMVMQDNLISLSAGISESLIVGDVIDASGNKAASVSDIAYLVVEPAQQGSKAVVVANPVMVVIAASGIETDLNRTAVIEKLGSLGFVFADYGTVALRTT